MGALAVGILVATPADPAKSPGVTSALGAMFFWCAVTILLAAIFSGFLHYWKSGSVGGQRNFAFFFVGATLLLGFLVTICAVRVALALTGSWCAVLSFGFSA
jgi:hypothetical protein